MKVFRGFDNLPEFKNPALSMGSYDGVHYGHRQLLATLKDTARRLKGESVVVTFEPHPRAVLQGAPMELLNTLDEKIMLLSAAGIDNLIVADFTPDFSRVAPDAFVRDYLVGKIGIQAFVIGYNHNFGHNKQGNYGFLKDAGQNPGFEVVEVRRQEVGGHKISSTMIRNLIAEGKLAEAAGFLGYNYFALLMEDQKGGFTLADPDKLMPPDGVYIVIFRTEAGDAPLEYRRLEVREGGITLTPPPSPAEVIVPVTEFDPATAPLSGCYDNLLIFNP